MEYTRLSGHDFLYIHYDIPIDKHDVIEVLSCRQLQRLRLSNIFSEGAFDLEIYT